MINNIRLANENDADELSRLNQLFNGGNRVATSKIIESLNSSDELIVVATLNEQIVGFACSQSFKSFCYTDAQGEITELYVEENSRGKGLATSMITFLEEQLISRGVKNIKILTGKNNHDALKTYSRCNYKIDDVITLQKSF